jgi:predicted hydrolase (HD superfamily)
MKKWSTRSFAVGADREVIIKGAAMTSKSIEELVNETILAMQKRAAIIGLDGNR